MDKPDPIALAEATDYLCKRCNTIVPRGTHHKMESCACGFISVDRGWYGSRVLWEEGKAEDAYLEIVGKSGRQAS